MEKGFTLVELLAVIVILAIILAIAVPGISSLINSATKSSFEDNTKMVFKAISYKMMNDSSFDPTTINETNIKSLLDIDDSNYKKVTVKMNNNVPDVIIVGKNKWDNLTASGTSTDLQVQEGLVLWLDAGNDLSYPGTGTTWYDLSGNGNNSTLVNGAVYNSDSGGNISFDGTDDYASFYAANLSNTATVEMWCKLGVSYSERMMFGWMAYDAYTKGGALGYNTCNGDAYGISSSTVTSLGIVNNWTHYIFEMRSDVSYTNNKIYINGNSQTLSQQYNTEFAGSRSLNNGNGRIASWIASNGYYMPMNCVTFKVYNRILSTSEIQENYNIFKDRLGL